MLLIDSTLGTVVRICFDGDAVSDDMMSCFEGLGNKIGLEGEKLIFIGRCGAIGDRSPPELEWLVKIEGERGAKVTFRLSLCL